MVSGHNFKSSKVDIKMSTVKTREKIDLKEFGQSKLLATALRTIAIAIAIVAKKAIEYCNMQ